MEGITRESAVSKAHDLTILKEFCPYVSKMCEDNSVKKT